LPRQQASAMVRDQRSSGARAIPNSRVQGGIATRPDRAAIHESGGSREPLFLSPAVDVSWSACDVRPADHATRIRRTFDGIAAFAQADIAARALRPALLERAVVR
jgi:hypothetical protein